MSLKYTRRYVDDVICLQSNALRRLASKIYPTSLPLTFNNCANGEGHYLDLKINRNTGLYQLYDKRTDFSFPVIRFVHSTSNQKESVGYAVFVSQLIRIARLSKYQISFIQDIKQLLQQIQANQFSVRILQQRCNATFERYTLLFEKLGFTSARKLSAAIFD